MIVLIGLVVFSATYSPVETPNGSSLPFRMVKGVKEFHLIAEPIKRELAPGMVINAWGYNGQTPGPTIEAVDGDRVRILVTNNLPEATSVHWHGILLPHGMDGVGGLTQPHIQPGETYQYEFSLRQHGTFMYHPHSDETTQMALGMMGFFIVHPKSSDVKVDRDFAIFLHEWLVPPGASTPDPNAMSEFNLFSMNGRVYPGTQPMVVRKNQRVRLRFANVTMDSHPVHFHGHVFLETGTDGGPIPKSAQKYQTTINVPPGSTRDVEFIADNEGDWPLHCHKVHHAMNQMGHGIPNMLGVKQDGVEKQVQSLLPGYMAMGEKGMGDMQEMNMPLPPNTVPMMAGTGPYGPLGMGGMFNLIKVRADIKDYRDPGWYKPPPGTTARPIKIENKR